MLGSTKDGVSSPKSSGHFEELRAYLCNKDTCAAPGFVGCSFNLERSVSWKGAGGSAWEGSSGANLTRHV